jgi:hypothetical protein
MKIKKYPDACPKCDAHDIWYKLADTCCPYCEENIYYDDFCDGCVTNSSIDCKACIHGGNL